MNINIAYGKRFHYLLGLVSMNGCCIITIYLCIWCFESSIDVNCEHIWNIFDQLLIFSKGISSSMRDFIILVFILKFLIFIVFLKNKVPQKKKKKLLFHLFHFNKLCFVLSVSFINYIPCHISLFMVSLIMLILFLAILTTYQHWY